MAACSLEKIHQLLNTNSPPKILVGGSPLLKLDRHPHPLQDPRKPWTSLKPRAMLCPGVQIHCEPLNVGRPALSLNHPEPVSSDLLAIMLSLALTQSHHPFSEPSLLGPSI